MSKWCKIDKLFIKGVGYIISGHVFANFQENLNIQLVERTHSIYINYRTTFNVFWNADSPNILGFQNLIEPGELIFNPLGATGQWNRLVTT